jgi:hypothetical protein
MPGNARGIEYVIWIPDKTTCAALQAQYPTGVAIAPGDAQALFNYTSTYGFPNVIDTSGSAAGNISGVLTPFNFTHFYTQGAQQFDGYTDEFGHAYPPFILFWIGMFVYSPAGTSVSPPPGGIRVGKRRFICGFELYRFFEMASQRLSSATYYSRDASRTPDGMGLAYRSSGSTSLGLTLDTNAANYPSFSYERFYIRLRTLPAAEETIWSCTGDSQAGAAVIMNVTPGGVLKLYNKGNLAYPGTNVITSNGLVINTWYRLDLFFRFLSLALGGQLQFFVNGVQAGGTVNFTTAGVSQGLGFQTGQKHASSSLGLDAGGGAQGLEADIDDWTNADYLDPTVGSHIMRVNITGFGTGNSGAFGGDWRELIGTPNDFAFGTNYPVSTSANAKLVVSTDYQDVQQGCCCFCVAGQNVTAATALGWLVNGATQVTAVGVTTSQAGSVLYNAVASNSVIAAIPALAPLQLVLQHDATVSSETVLFLGAAAEYLGVFGNEDLTAASGVTIPPFPGIHNHPYTGATQGTGVQANLNGTAQLQLVPPFGVVQVMAGVYIGNNLGQDIAAQIAPHWLFIRPLVGASFGGARVFTGMISAHVGRAKALPGDAIEQLLGGGVNTPGFRVATNDGNSNANGAGYQWIAVSDPAFRYVMNGAFAHRSGLASVTNTLIDPAFTPDCAFFWVEALSAATTGFFYKGPGDAGNEILDASTGAIATGAAMAAGALTSKAAIHTDLPQTAYSLWRKNDGSGSTGLFDCVSYVGDGTASRNIAVALNGYSPLFAIVWPHNAQALFKDPSHPVTTSQALDQSSTTTTGIIGGDLNIVKVGVTANALGITYDLFVIAGTINAGAWSPNPATPIVPVLPDVRPAGPPFTAAPTPPVALPIDCISFQQAINELADRLGDPNQVHWTSAELQRYLKEALRTWNAYTQTQRDQGTFATTVGVPFYDLPTLLDKSGTKIRAYTLTDRELVTDLEYSLMEPPTPTAWSGTAMFNLGELTEALLRRRDRFLRETGTVLVRDVTAIVIPATGRFVLPLDVITVRRAAWVMNSGTVVPLQRDDEWGMNQYQRTWQTATNPTTRWPTVYSTGVTPPLTIQLAPPPSANGSLDLVASRQGAALDPTTGVILGVPDDYAWVVKFGALADLLSGPGPNNDPARARRCEERWTQGVTLATRASVVLAAKIGTGVVRVYSLNEADTYLRGWQNTQGVPSRVLLAGLNLTALSPVPDALGPYTVTLDVIRNMPMPTLVTDCFYDGGNSILEPIFAYAQYLALFKEGPQQFEAAQDLLQRFLMAAGTTEFLDQAQTPGRGPMFQQQVQDTRAKNRQTMPPEDTVETG